MPRLVLIAVVSYLLGSVPFGYLLVRIFRGEDVRQSGSGNIGATNVSRKSPALGALTLILDAAKGGFAVQLSVMLSPYPGSDPRLYRLMAASALLSIVGHMFPIWLGFSGGKGVATALGAFLRLSPATVGVGILIFLVVAAVSRRVSLASIVTAVMFPVAYWFAGSSRDAWTLIFISLAALLIVVRHHQNIRRLLAGDEPQFSMGHK